MSLKGESIIWAVQTAEFILQQARKISKRDPEKDKTQRLFEMFYCAERILRKLENSIAINSW